MSLGFKR